MFGQTENLRSMRGRLNRAVFHVARISARQSPIPAPTGTLSPRACRKLWRRPDDGLYRPKFHALFTVGRPKQTDSNRFCSHTVQAPANPKPFRNHSMASNLRIVRRAEWKD